MEGEKQGSFALDSKTERQGGRFEDQKKKKKKLSQELKSWLSREGPLLLFQRTQV